MPNHVHGIIVIHDQAAVSSPPAEYPSKGVGAHYAAPLRTKRDVPFRPNVQPGSLGAIVRSYKSAVTRAIGHEFGAQHIWQRNDYEHVIRDENDWNRIHLYIESNIANWAEDEENTAK